MGQPRLLLAVEVVVLLVSLACATPESGYVTDLSDHSEVVLLQENPMDKAKASVAQLAVKAKTEELEAVKTTIVETGTKKVRGEAELSKLQAEAASEVAKIAQMKDPVVNATMPADPAVVAQAADKLADVQIKLAATKKEVDESAQALTVARDTAVSAEEAAAEAKVNAIKKAESSKAAKLMADAKAKNDKLVAAKKALDDGIKADKEKKEKTLSNAEKAVIDAKEEQSAIKIKDETTVNKLTVDLATLKVRIKAAKKAVQTGLIQDRSSKYQLVLKKHTLHMDKQLVKEAEAAKSALETRSSDAEGDRKRGIVLLGQAKEAIEVNKDRIKAARMALHQAYTAFRDAEHDKKMDEDQVATAQETIDEMNVEAMKLEKKKELVRSFGATLRSKAERDASVAKTGLARAQGEYEDNKVQYEQFTKIIVKKQAKIDKYESERQKTISAVLTALGEDNGAASIQAGEAHEGIDKLIRKVRKKKSKVDVQASNVLAGMSAAKKEEKSALSLQVAANAQFNQAKRNDDTLSQQSTQLNSLYSEQAERKTALSTLLAKALKKVTEFQLKHHAAQKVFEARVAAGRYLKDVKMPVAQKLVDGVADMPPDGAGPADEESKLEKSQRAVDKAQGVAAKAAHGIVRAKAELSDLMKKAATKKQELMTAKLLLETNTSGKQIQVEKAEMYLHDVRHPITSDTMDSAAVDAELKTKLNAAAAARDTVEGSAKELTTKTESAKSSEDDKEKEDLSGTKKNHEAEVAKMNKADDAVQKAKEMYHKAFGPTIEVPGHKEHSAAQAKTQSESSAVVTAAAAVAPAMA